MTSTEGVPEKAPCAQCGCSTPDWPTSRYEDVLYCDHCWRTWCIICSKWQTDLRPLASDDKPITATRWLCGQCPSPSPEALTMLRSLDDVQPAFQIWKYMRREDGGGRVVRAAIPVPQPCVIPKSHLFLGDQDDALNVPGLVDRGIKAVLNLCVNQNPPRTEMDEYLDSLCKHGILYREVMAQDRAGYDIVTETFPDALAFLDATRKFNRPTLVHCYGGINRSSAVVVGYLVTRLELHLVDAVSQVTEARGSVLTNQSFRLFLCEFALKRKEQETAKEALE